MAKYELTDEVKKFEVYRDDKCVKIKLYRIKATANFSNVDIGDLGGFVEKINNLSVTGNSWISDDACVSGDACVSDDADIVWFSKFGSALRTTTAFKTKENGVAVVCGCSNGNLECFQAEIIKTHSDNKYAKEYLLMVEMIKVHFDMNV